MTEILYRWLDEELRIPVARDADTFLQQFSNGKFASLMPLLPVV